MYLCVSDPTHIQYMRMKSYISIPRVYRRLIHELWQGNLRQFENLIYLIYIITYYQGIRK